MACRLSAGGAEGLPDSSFADKTVNPRRDDLVAPEIAPENLSCRGFTLIELLVVIAIIGILASLLLPSISQAYRRARVLGSTITYLDEEGTLWVVNPRTGKGLQVGKGKSFVRDAVWSPDGKYIATATGANLVVIDPVTEKTKHLPYLENPTWISSEELQGTKYMGSVGNELWRVDMRTGRDWLWKPLAQLGLPHGQITAKFEPYLGDGFLVCEPFNVFAPEMDVVTRNMDWQLQREIWVDETDDTMDLKPRIDQVGEKVGWTRARIPGWQDITWCIAVKSLEDDPGDPPELFGLKFQDALFLDWLSPDEMLVSVQQNGKWTMAVMDSKGKVLKEYDHLKPVQWNWADVRRQDHW